MYDLMITSASKALTAPLLFAVVQYLPDFVVDGLEMAEFLEEGQYESSNFGDANNAVQSKRSITDRRARIARWAGE